MRKQNKPVSEGQVIHSIQNVLRLTDRIAALTRAVSRFFPIPLIMWAELVRAGNHGFGISIARSQMSFVEGYRLRSRVSLMRDTKLLARVDWRIVALSVDEREEP